MKKQKAWLSQKFSQRKSGRLLASSLVVLLVLSLFAWYVLADPSHTIADGTVSSSTLAFVRSGFSHNMPVMNNPSVIGQVKMINISGVVNNYSFVLYKPGSINEKITNMSIMWQLRSNNSIMRNDSLSNVSGTPSCPATMNCNNMTSFNVTFDTEGSLPDGVYNLTIFIYNFSEGPSSINVTNSTLTTNITVDNTAPRVANVTINATNATNYTRTGWLLLTAHVNDSTTAIKRTVVVELINLLNNSRANSSSATPSQDTWNYTFDFSTLGDGRYIINLVANDSVDNINAGERNVSFYIDGSAPNVTATSADGLQDRNLTTTVTLELVLNATINDTITSLIGFPRFDFKTNGTAFNRTASLYEGKWNLSNLNMSMFSQGRHTVTIYANDSLANANNTQTIGFRIDGTVPQLTNLTMNFTNATNFTRSGVIKLNVSANDTITTPTAVIFEIVGLTNGTRFNVTVATSGSPDGPQGAQWATDMPLSTLTDGVYDVRVYANDSANNMNVSITIQNVSFNVDGSVPNVTSTSADGLQDRNFTTTVTVELVLNATVNDTFTGLKGFPRFDFKTNGTAFNRTASLYEGKWNLSNLNMSMFTQGRHTVTIYANDSLANANNTQTISFRIDAGAPQLNNLTMNFTNGTNFTNSGVIKLNITANDSITVPNGVIFEIVGLRNNTRFNITLASSSSPDGPQGAQWTTDMPLSTFQDGVYDVRAYANDTLNNVNLSISMQNITFTVDGTAPTVVAYGMNVTNNSAGRNYTNVGFLAFNASVNDTTTFVAKGVTFEFTNLQNGSVSNTSITSPEYRITDYFHSFRLNISLAEKADGRYTVRIHANDSLGNRMTPLANVSFTVDSTLPQTVIYGMNVSNNSAGVNFTNSGFIAINASVNDTTTAIATGVIFEVTNLHNGSVLNISVGSSEYGIAGYYSSFRVNLSFAERADGRYTVRIHANDSLGNRLTPLANVSFSVDRTPPNVTSHDMNNFTTGVNLSAGLSTENSLTLNVTVNETVSGVVNVTFSITNGTNATHGPINLSASMFDARWNATFNISRLSEGNHNVTVVAINGLRQRNDSFLNASGERLTFTVDRGAPTLTVTCTPANPIAGQTVTCECSSVDTVSNVRLAAQFTSGKASESTTATGSGTFTSSTCTSTDFSDNAASGSATWTVTAASGGGGGAGGAGGGAASGVKGESAQQTWTSINPGETAKVEVANGAIGVTEVSLQVKDTIYGGWVKVEKESGLPSGVSSFSGKTYKIVEITKGTALKDEKITKAEIKFKVEKSWLTDNKLSKERVALHRFADGKWNELATTLGQDDGTFVHYTAETPGFSLFVIGEKTKAAEVAAAAPTEAPVEEAPVAAPEAAPVAAPTEAEVAPEAAGISALPIVALVIVLVAVVLVLLGLKKKKR